MCTMKDSKVDEMFLHQSPNITFHFIALITSKITSAQTNESTRPKIEVHAEHITPVFNMLRSHARGQKVEKCIEYIDETWITNPVWSVSSWLFLARVSERIMMYCRGLASHNKPEGQEREFTVVPVTCIPGVMIRAQSLLY